MIAAFLRRNGRSLTPMLIGVGAAVLLSLAVGIGAQEGFPGEEKLLLLDPNFPPFSMMPWNATLSLNPSRRGWHNYDTPAGRAKVYLSDAVCLLPSIEEMDLDID